MANELSALVEAVGEAVDRLAITPAESLQSAVSRRVFRAVGPASTPTRFIHDSPKGRRPAMVGPFGPV